MAETHENTIANTKTLNSKTFAKRSAKAPAKRSAKAPAKRSAKAPAKRSAKTPPESYTRISDKKELKKSLSNPVNGSKLDKRAAESREKAEVVNHVMSNDQRSGIFSDIISYFQKYSPKNIRHVTSSRPIENADIYHYHRPHLEKKLLKNSVCTVHHDLLDTDPWHCLSKFLPRYEETGAVICLNSTQRKILTDEGLAEEKLHLSSHGFNDKMLRPIDNSRLQRNSSKTTLGMASKRYGRRVKGEAYLLELIKRLDPEQFRFILIGKDRCNDAFLFRRFGFEVQVYERLPYRLFQSFYEEIDALLMCSTFEGGPANIPESLATGTPVFSSRVGMAADMIFPNRNGIFLNLDPDEDAARIHNICVAEPSKLKKLRKMSLSMAKNIPTWRQSVENNLTVYKSLQTQMESHLSDHKFKKQ